MTNIGIELLGQLNRERIFGEGRNLVQERDGALKREGEKDFFGLIRGKKIRTEWKREEKVEDTWVLNMHQEKKYYPW